MVYQWARRLRQYYVLVIVGLIGLAAILRAVGFEAGGRAGCDAAPVYRDAVPAELRTWLDTLQAQELLYCRDLREGLASVDPRVYWGSDGMNSVIFFQARPGQDLTGVGVTDYTFGDGSRDFFPSRMGDRRHIRFDQAQEGRRVWANEAEGSPPTYFVRLDGAPPVGLVNAYFKIRGPALEQRGVTDRDFLQDLERFWGLLRREPQSAVGGRLVSRDLTVIYDPERWADWVGRDVNPALTDAEGRVDYEALATEPIAEPILYQTVQGLSGSTVWVAGVVSGTRPAMLLLPRGGGAPIEPIGGGTWISFRGGSALAHFAFPRQPDGAVLEARFWADAEARDREPPTRSWPVAFPPPPALAPAAEATDEAGA